MRDAGTDYHLRDGFRSLAIIDSARNSFASSRLSSDLDVDGGLTYSKQLLKILSERRGSDVSNP